MLREVQRLYCDNCGWAGPNCGQVKCPACDNRSGPMKWPSSDNQRARACRAAIEANSGAAVLLAVCK
jgi:hypothetical protein